MRRPLPALLLIAGSACTGSACGPPPAPPRPAVAERVQLREEPAATVVAVALAFPGSGWELPGLQGLTLLTAETLLEQTRDALESLGASAEVECGRTVFVFTLVAPTDSWRPALEALLDGVFEPSPAPAAVERAGERLARRLALDQASPAWQARLAIRQALHGDSLTATSWSGPACGVPETLPLFDTARVRAGAYRFAPRMARAAVVGGPGAAAAARLIRSRLPDEPPVPVPAPAQTRPGRRYVERNTVTAWTTLGYPFAAGTDPEALRLLAALLEEELGPSVARPDVFTVSHELERHGGGGALILHFVTAPEAAARTAAGAEAWIRGIVRSGVPPALWERVIRSYGGRRLLELEAPEARAAALARGLATGATNGTGWPTIGRLTPDRVREAAGRLGAPARSVVGPRSARSAVMP